MLIYIDMGTEPILFVTSHARSPSLLPTHIGSKKGRVQDSVSSYPTKLERWSQKVFVDAHGLEPSVELIEQLLAIAENLAEAR